MHEFSLAVSIIEIVTETAKRAEKEKVVKIRLQIGELSGVEEEALNTALESLVQIPMLKDAKIETERTTGKAKCIECSKEYVLSDILDSCPHCESYFKDIISGKEFNVLSIDAE